MNRLLSRSAAKARRAGQITNAFLRMDAREQFNYPLGLIMREVGAIVPVITFFFVAEFVKGDESSPGGDYYTFVVVGIIGMRLLAAGLQSLSRRVTLTINQGRLEMLLVEPLRWKLLPFTMVQWNIVMALVSGLVMFGTSLLLGARYRWEGLPAAAVIMVLGLSATLGIGILNTAIKVLGKRGDVILNLYTIAATILSGTFYSVDVLPSWLRVISWMIPHTYVLQALRRVLLPAGAELSGPSAFQASLALLAFSVLIYPIALWLYGRTFEFGRKMGLLSGY